MSAPTRMLILLIVVMAVSMLIGSPSTPFWTAPVWGGLLGLLSTPLSRWVNEGEL
jgi:hypothetical protein